MIHKRNFGRPSFVVGLALSVLPEDEAASKDNRKNCMCSY